MVLSNLSHLLTISQFAVDVYEGLLGGVAFGVDSRHETSEEERLDTADGVVRLLESLLHVDLDHFYESLSISVRDETIVESPSALVSPQLDEIVFISDGLGAGLGDTLEDLRHISQVISVMRFSRSRSEFSGQFLVSADGTNNHLLFESADTRSVGGLIVLHEVPFHNRVENDVEGTVGVGLNVKGVEMADESASDHGLSSSGRSHSSSHRELGNLTEILLFTLDLEPALVVHPLTEQLNGRLSSVNSGLFDLRHAQVIDEHDSSAVAFGDVVTLTKLHQFSIENILGLTSGGLGGESHADVGPIIVGVGGT